MKRSRDESNWYAVKGFSGPWTRNQWVASQLIDPQSNQSRDSNPPHIARSITPVGSVQGKGIKSRASAATQAAIAASAPSVALANWEDEGGQTAASCLSSSSST